MLLLSRFIISGHSMEPILKAGHTVLVSNIPYLIARPKIGDIIAFKHEKKIFVKRVTKTNLSADGEKYFIKGDNKNDSLDSRSFGWIEKKEIVGKVIYRLSS